jgi:hypothetical protein
LVAKNAGGPAIVLTVIVPEPSCPWTNLLNAEADTKTDTNPVKIG